MSLLNGSATIRRLKVTDGRDPTQDTVHFLTQGRFKDRELSINDKPNCGFVVLDNELSTEFTQSNVFVGNFKVFSFRRDELKIPTADIRLEMQARLTQRMYDDKLEHIGAKQRAEIKEEVIEELSQTAPTKRTICQVAMYDGTIYVTTTSESIIDSLTNHLLKHLGISVIDMNPSLIAQRNLTEEDYEKILDHPGLDLIPEVEAHPEFEDTPEGKLGSGLLTWLFWELHANGDGMVTKDRGMFFEEPVTLTGESVGAREVKILKGAVLQSTEFKNALKVGKQLSKVRVNICGDTVDKEDDEDVEQWNFTTDKYHMDLCNAKFPKVDEPEDHARHVCRLLSIVEAFEILDTCLVRYLKIKLGDPTLSGRIGIWIDSL